MRMIQFAIVLLVTSILSAEPQVRYSPFWTSDADCVTTVHLRNNVVDSDLIVSPIFHREDGTAVVLAPITIPASGSAEILVNEVIGGSGHYYSHYGGAEFHFDALYAGALSVETEVVMSEHTLAYSVQSFGQADRSANEQHAVFVLPNRNGEIYFAMYNSSDERVTVRPTIQSGGSTVALDSLAGC